MSYTGWTIQGLPPLWFTSVATSLVCFILQNAGSFLYIPPLFYFSVYIHEVEEWQKWTRFLGEEKRYNTACRLNEVAYATHPAHSVGRLCTTSRCGVVSQGDGIHWLFMHCAPTWYGKPFPLLSRTTTALECINCFEHKQFQTSYQFECKALETFLLFSKNFEAFWIFGRSLSLLEKAICFVNADGY